MKGFDKLNPNGWLAVKGFDKLSPNGWLAVKGFDKLSPNGCLECIGPDLEGALVHQQGLQQHRQTPWIATF